MKKVLTVIALSLLALAAFAQTPVANNVLGDVVAVDAGAKTIFVKTDGGAVVTVTLWTRRRL